MEGNQRHILVMGVTGVGKTTVAERLADALGCRFVEADDYHPRTNIDAMSKGIPLTDAMRWPWLDKVCDAVDNAGSSPVVLACSALKQSYRDLVRRRLGELRIIHLTGSRDLICDRMLTRKGHYMPVSLIESQFADLEAPCAPEEDVLNIDIAGSLDGIVAEALAFCRRPEEPADLPQQSTETIRNQRRKP